MATKNLAIASSIYLNLKPHRGHWHNEKRNSLIDDHNGDRHRAMIELQAHLGQIGTSATEIEHLMGEPTKILSEPDEILLNELKRHDENYVFPKDAKVWIYEWRHYHDFVYFFISKDQKVIHSSWYYTYE